MEEKLRANGKINQCIIRKYSNIRDNLIHA